MTISTKSHLFRNSRRICAISAFQRSSRSGISPTPPDRIFACASSDTGTNSHRPQLRVLNAVVALEGVPQIGAAIAHTLHCRFASLVPFDEFAPIVGQSVPLDHLVVRRRAVVRCLRAAYRAFVGSGAVVPAPVEPQASATPGAPRIPLALPGEIGFRHPCPFRLPALPFAR